MFTEENYLQFPRFQLVALAVEKPDWVDAKLTNSVQGAEKFKDKIPDYYSFPVSIPEHM